MPKAAAFSSYRDFLIGSHLFLPGRPMADAYADSIVFTHRDVDGTVLSCTTLSSGVAEMLEQLDVQPGHRVLEIGAGTGINAALLACLAGPDGHVTTIDILPEAAEEARQGLAAAGYADVMVICGDGASGHPAGCRMTGSSSRQHPGTRP
jgi:protein-L-isoaspartate(D-aspartate) O-methyltransferase